MIWLAVVAVIAIASYASWRLGRASADRTHESAAIANLQSLNALLRTLTRSPDVTRSLFELALRVRAIVPCDRVGLALLTEDREGYTTYTARLDAEGPSSEPTPDLHFPRTGTLIDEVVNARDGRVVPDTQALAPQFLDANVLHNARFASVLFVPLIFEGEALGTLNLVSRRREAFSQADLDTLKPVAEALAAAYGTRRLAQALARHQMANELADLTFAFANDMSGAVQALVGGCELLGRESVDPAMQSGVKGLLEHARRLRDILSQMQRMTRAHSGKVQRDA